MYNMTWTWDGIERSVIGDKETLQSLKDIMSTYNPDHALGSDPVITELIKDK